MKYAHLADAHLGAWREEKMRDISTLSFLTAIDTCIKERVDFILFAGDLFNTSLPSLDTLKIVTKKLKELKDNNIPFYAIAGSHDFSPSGKTMIDVLENAGLLKNVCKGRVDPESKKVVLDFTIDEKTGAKMTGILGRKGLLDKTYYQNLSLENLEKEEGYKIFLFHTTLTELKPKHLEMLEAQPASFLPKNFNYYAGGHIHHPNQVEIEQYGVMTYPGALFPNSFAEMEKYGKGGYYIITVEEKSNDSQNKSKNKQEVQWVPLDILKHEKCIVHCQHQSPEKVAQEMVDFFRNKDLTKTIVTIRLTGILRSGKISDIDFKAIFEQLYQQGAYFIMKNTVELNSEEFSEIKISQSNPELMEEEIIKEHLQQLKIFDTEAEMHLTKSLLLALNTSKKEGENVADFQQRIESEMSKILNLELQSS